MDLQVWVLAARAVATDEAAALLTADETARAGQFAVPGARDLFVASRAVQRTLGSALLGVAPQQVPIGRTCLHCGHRDHGKPRFLARQAPEYSVSHSGALVLVGYARTGRIGLDIEADDRRTDLAGLIPRIASPAERRRLGRVPPPDLRRACLRLWTRKEAVVKLTGHGLALPFTRFSVDEAVASADEPVPDWPDEPVWLRDLPVEPGYTAALATSPAPAEVTVARLTSLAELRVRRATAGHPRPEQSPLRPAGLDRAGDP
ncbi:4'-phosphopantetheinyl transferase superfamily protein [Micromonospora sp. WMMD1102]|uniref:4'-phosphopantetheinyl transferase family protein n=1 Tax=Micromonospora sp. WMMD1102 TaxID=3016105 RepID=UPI0024154CCB|nr:4'-phosphopantetheinyl transferase superfamily protein [Micromonospora sp. WMMD1102]MDG4785106.1 4'-phosphopantetheinyl transferase superfamily protein [Micromonospora sp. WMMD1102]